MGRCIAIRYSPDGYVSRGKVALGRRVAGDSFLSGLLRHGGLEKLVALVHNARDEKGCAEEIASRAPGMRVETASLESPQTVESAGTLYLPGPGLEEYAWWRRRAGNQRAFSLCGITHTTATGRVMDALCRSTIAPVQTWDAIICTSRAVRGMVQRQIEGYADYLREATGAQILAQPMLPVIPLGVDCDKFRIDRTDGEFFRAHLGIGREDIAVLIVARLSVSTKFSPLPLYLALQKASTRTHRKFHVMLAGWLDKDSREAFIGAGRGMSPDVGVHLLNGQDEKVRHNAWSAADVFTLPVDNVQETFGIAPVEAMAAGLPVVATDWDGFRDTIVHGETGFLIPTAMGGKGENLAMRHQMGIDSYESYMRGVSQCVAMDIDAASESFARLASDADLRRRMGEEGQRRARQCYDWAAVIPQYLELWDEQARLRAEASEFAPPSQRAPHAPSHPDPFELFADYPTLRVDAQSVARLSGGGSPEKLRRIAKIPSTVGRGSQLPSLPALDAILHRLSHTPASVEELATECAGGDLGKTKAGLCWLAKHGMVSFGAEISADAPRR
jgi:starch synthase